MCGIFMSILRRDNCEQKENKQKLFEGQCMSHDYPCPRVQEYLKRRGPDTSREVNTDLTEQWTASLMGSVLWIQGQEPCAQPLQDEHGNFLLWNGDVLHGALADEVDNGCDSEVVFGRFKMDPLATVAEIYGPYAFVFWQSSCRRLWFGRDVFGRQSLLWRVSPDQLTLSSVAHKQSGLTELPAVGIFMVDLNDTLQVEVELFPWAHLSACLQPAVTVVRQPVSHCELRNGWGQCPGGQEEPGELELAAYDPSLGFSNLLRDQSVSARVDGLLKVLSSAVECRVTKHSGACRQCHHDCWHCSVAVLFSGGLDSSVLALLADMFVPADRPLDLYNVAFQLPSGGYEVPDRLTGRATLQELKSLAPNRKWNFVEIDISREELASDRSQTIVDLIDPLSSVLDDSLGCALWFAARGKGHCNLEPYTSPARIILVGMGADEQLGGYSRHRNTLRRAGWAALLTELRADTDNISRRNLGRDNRVMCDHGRQPRTPFLDERVVAYISALPPWHRCVAMPGGDKLLLRLAAYRLGLRGASTLPKRALQFGSRIADRKEKGHQVSQRL